MDISEERTNWTVRVVIHQKTKVNGVIASQYFENITRAFDQNPVICPDLTQEDSQVDYLLSILTEEILEIFQDQTNLYAT